MFSQTRQLKRFFKPTKKSDTYITDAGDIIEQDDSSISDIISLFIAVAYIIKELTEGEDD